MMKKKFRHLFENDGEALEFENPSPRKTIPYRDRPPRKRNAATGSSKTPAAKKAKTAGTGKEQTPRRDEDDELVPQLTLAIYV